MTARNPPLCDRTHLQRDRPGTAHPSHRGRPGPVVFKNELTTPTSTHWHGQFVPSNMDGVAQPELSQKPVMPGELNEWRVIDGVTYPAMPSMGEPNYFTVNGKTYPDIPTINVKQGQRVRLRFVGAGQFEHPMHLHGSGFRIVATDGFPVPPAAELTKNTIPVHPGERFDVEFVADSPGKWALHCHIVHHTTNNDVEPGGLLMVINVQS